MDKYKDHSRDDLIKKVEELELLVEALKDDKDHEELLIFPWTGNLGHWYWNIKTDKLICNDKKITTLNYRRDEVPEDIGHEFFISRLHPDDYEMVMEDMREHLSGKTQAYEVEYRIRTKEGNWKWYYDIGKVTKKDEEGKPVLLAGIVFDITEKKEMELLVKEQNENLEKMVNLDYLTKVFNRRAIQRKLESEIAKSEKNKEKLSIIMIDIDEFKSVNDHHGHLVGDLVLKRIAKSIKKSLLGSDIVGRYGGEEFLVILPNTNREEARIVGERIRENIKKEQFTNGVRVTISGGVKEYNRESINKFLDEADKSLYYAKKRGRNKVVCCEC